MNSILASMLEKYEHPVSENEAKNVIKQAMQEIALCGFGRSDFYQNVAFNGGTALRIFHNLTRFSEDLDFSIDGDKMDLFSISNYAGYLDDAFESLGIPAKFEIDSEEGFVKRGYIRGNCRDVLNCFDVDKNLVNKVSANEVIRIKIELDAVNLVGANFETKYLLQPYPTPVRLYDKPTLFAGKINAVLTRNWKNRVKGRDLYDYLFYLSGNCRVNMRHLESRLKNNGYIKENELLNENLLKSLLVKKFAEIDYVSAKSDVLPFIIDSKSIDLWSKEMFIAITEEYSF